MSTTTEPEVRTLLSERASLAGPAKLSWKVRRRGGQDVELQHMDSVPALRGGSGIEARSKNASVDKPSYVRGEFSFTLGNGSATLSLHVQMGVDGAESVNVHFVLADDAEYKNELLKMTQLVRVSEGAAELVKRLELRGASARRPRVCGFLQVFLPTVGGAAVSIGRVSLTAAARSNGVRIRFDPWGDQTRASSRLRVFKLAEALREAGHEVSVGEGLPAVDVHFCQKVRPFADLAAVRKANPRAVLVYDFDDNYMLKEHGVLSEVLAFMNHVDVVTCGSEYLAELVRPWHHNVFVLENPLDIADAGLARAPTGRLENIGWFGAAEGLMELDPIDIAASVRTVTKGGDIEFSLATIDSTLLGFDLLVFPVEETPWNLAKNANRMMKALGLGIPVLASDTPEQRRIAELTGLPPECLVAAGTPWSQAVERLRARYPEVEKAVLRARELLWKSHAPRDIAMRLLAHVTESTQPGAVRARRARTLSFARVAVFIVDGSPDARALATLRNSRVDWKGFHSVHVFAAARLSNQLYPFAASNFSARDGDFLAVFEGADRAMDACEADYLLVVPAGVALAHGFAYALDRVIDREPLAVFARNCFFSPKLVGKAEALPLRALFTNPEVPGPLLLSNAWAGRRGKHWSTCYEMWPWAILVQALTSDPCVRFFDQPTAFDALPEQPLNASAQYAAWLTEHNPEVARELPSVANQWDRVLTDVVADAVSNLGAELPAIVAQLYVRHAATARQLAEAELKLGVGGKG